MIMAVRGGYARSIKIRRVVSFIYFLRARARENCNHTSSASELPVIRQSQLSFCFQSIMSLFAYHFQLSEYFHSCLWYDGKYSEKWVPSNFSVANK